MAVGYYRGEGIIFLSKFIKAHGAAIEQKFIQSLDDEAARVFLRTANQDWVPAVVAARLYALAAEQLYPGDPQALRHLGRERARNSFSGIYKTLLKLATIPAIIKRAAKIWEYSYELGTASVEYRPGEKEAVFVVRDYPDFPPVLMEVGCGYIQGVVEFSRVANVRVVTHSDDPQAWKWLIQWE